LQLRFGITGRHIDNHCNTPFKTSTQHSAVSTQPNHNQPLALSH
jgi:hypothetical protein